MWLDALALLVLAIFIGIGALRGALQSALGLIALGAAYAAAIWAAPRFGPALASWLEMPEWVGIPLAGTAGFAAAFLAVGVVSSLVRRRDRRRKLPRSARDRFLGGVLGGVRGSLVVLLLSWLALWADALRATGTVDAIPEIDGSAAAAVTESVVEAGVEAVMGDSASARVVARMAARPGAALVDVQQLVENPNIAGLQQDPLFWTYVENGSVDAALNRSSFLRITHDEALRAQLAELGVIEASAASEPAAFRDAAGEMLRQLGPRLRALRDDPALQELVADPEVQSALQSGNTLALLTHPGFRQLVASVATAPGT